MSVYFAKAGDYIKIGYSRNPFSRAESITRMGKRPADLPLGAEARLLGWVPGDRDREAEIHTFFTKHRVAGEWFTVSKKKARDFIWADPAGVDIYRMSAWATFAAFNRPGVTRDELAAAGVPVLAVALEDAPMFRRTA